MEIPQIKDKITARAFALVLSSTSGGYISSIIDRAKKFENYIIGDAELPEIQEDTTKSWVNTLSSLCAKQFEENREKMSKDWKELIETLPKIEIKDNTINTKEYEANKE